jgi:preprotein translocase subunit SecG
MVQYHSVVAPHMDGNCATPGIERKDRVEIALFIALIVISAVLIALVVLQARSPGMANRDTSSIYRTRRGLEKTLYQATLVLSVSFLLLSLIASLPIFG